MNNRIRNEVEESPSLADLNLDELPSMEPWDTADYLRQERMVGLDANCVSDDGNDCGLSAGGDWLGGYVDQEEMANFTQIIAIPGPLLTSEIVELWRRIYMRIQLGVPPETDGELIIRATRAALIAQGLGKKVTPGALIIGCLLAVGKAEKVAIQPHPRDLAKDLGTRYQTLLTVRRTALAQIAKHGAQLGLSVD